MSGGAGQTCGPPVGVSQVLHAPGAAVQVAKETPGGKEVPAMGGWSRTAAVGGRAAQVTGPTRALGALGLHERRSGKFS